MWPDWLVFCDCGFQSVCPLMEKDKRLMEASWWKGLTEAESVCCCCCWVASVVSDSVRPQRWQPTRLSHPWILQARTLECVAISFSSASKWKVKVKSLSCVRLLATPWTTAHHAPPSMWFLGKSTGVGCLIINKVSNSSSLWKIYLYLSMCLSVYIFTCPAFKI